MHSSSQQKGFSLIELLVVVAVFSTITLVITDIYVNVSNSQRRTLAWQQVQSELRYAIELIAETTRQGQLDYAYADYPTELTLPEDELAIIDKAGENVIFNRETASCTSGIPGCIRISKAGVWHDLTSNQVEITKLDFYIMPRKDPFEYDPIAEDYLAEDQPLVVIIIEGKSLGVTEIDQKTLSIQTAVATRHYER
jgi:prepilin-type N-terminal cleavage/methylation domain-containing protein